MSPASRVAIDDFGSVRGTLRIEGLDGPTFDKYSEGILSLERAVWAESAEQYASYPWNADNFARLLPGKERYSLVVVTVESQEVVGFLVAHSKYGNVHMSRFAVKPAKRSGSVLMAMYGDLFRRMRDTGIRVVTGQVRAQNQRNVAVYEGMRFQRLRDAELRAYIAAHRLNPLDVSEDRFISSDRSAYFAYSLTLP